MKINGFYTLTCVNARVSGEYFVCEIKAQDPNNYADYLYCTHITKSIDDHEAKKRLKNTFCKVELYVQGAEYVVQDTGEERLYNKVNLRIKEIITQDTSKESERGDII